MPNQGQFAHRKAALSVASGLIGGLSGVAAAPDLSDQSARAEWVIEQRRGESIGPNATSTA